MTDIKQGRIGLIVGSNRPQRLSRPIAEWLGGALAHDGLAVSLIDLAAVNLPFLDEPDIPARGNYQHAHTKAWSETIRAHDGFILLFPQYNWGYPAVLKNALDYLYAEWAGKPVSLVSFGGHGGFQAMLAMNLVVSGLRMVQMATNLQLTVPPEIQGEPEPQAALEHVLAPYRSDVRSLADEFARKLSKA
ncbi:MAG: NADPH-dependent FMN reductase [Sporolactobacillus sp.]